MAALIELVCSVHLDASTDGPLVTTIENVWAYCAGAAEGGHEWRRIGPTALELLRAGIQAPLPSPQPAQ